MDFQELCFEISCDPPVVWPYALITEREGKFHRYTLEEVLTVVVEQLRGGKMVVVIPPPQD